MRWLPFRRSTPARDLTGWTRHLRNIGAALDVMAPAIQNVAVSVTSSEARVSALAWHEGRRYTGWTPLDLQLSLATLQPPNGGGFWAARLMEVGLLLDRWPGPPRDPLVLAMPNGTLVTALLPAPAGGWRLVTRMVTDAELATLRSGKLR
ncbi:MAG TPA: hypothetical protein VIL01_12265 [Thermomicrobiales bacterium]